jgi:hypothetical protein
MNHLLPLARTGTANARDKHFDRHCEKDFIGEISKTQGMGLTSETVTFESIAHRATEGDGVK